MNTDELYNEDSNNRIALYKIAFHTSSIQSKVMNGGAIWGVKPCGFSNRLYRVHLEDY